MKKILDSERPALNGRRELLAKLADDLERELFPSRLVCEDLWIRSLRALCAVALGACAGGLSVFAIFIVVNLIFHYQP
jgi:hypothetical protein